MQNERKNKVRLVIDTDLGCDSDDALALALACRLHGRGKTQLAAITCATARPAAPAAAPPPTGHEEEAQEQRAH